MLNAALNMFKVSYKNLRHFSCSLPKFSTMLGKESSVFISNFRNALSAGCVNLFLSNSFWLLFSLYFTEMHYLTMLQKTFERNSSVLYYISGEVESLV